MDREGLFSDILIQKLKSSKAVAILTGAGVSAESGVPTFRGKNGLWKKFRPEELATMKAFLQNPKIVWEWYEYRRKLISEVKPNPAHYALRDLEKIVDKFSLITQNIDGLHQKAGSKNVIELHGNIKRNRCISCNQVYTNLEFESEDIPPRCSCGSMIRPDVVWFGEMLPQQALSTAFKASQQCDIFMSIGTSALVSPASQLPIIALRNNAYVVEINLESTVISNMVHEVILGKAGEILPKLINNLI
jgi:NAD-dependent deacetylase